MNNANPLIFKTVQNLRTGQIINGTEITLRDLFAGLARLGDISIHLDRKSYPVAAWGAVRAASLGTPIRRFRHHDPTSLRKQLANLCGRRPAVVTGGFCPECGAAAPLGDYLEAVR